MWPSRFEERLQRWNDLRVQCDRDQLGEAMSAINRWWMATPWTAYYLHWDDLPRWPDPWQLLSDNIYCDLARSLGIVYTLLMLERSDVPDAAIVETNHGNLVLVDGGKYILNWSPEPVLNIAPVEFAVNKSLDSSRLIHLLG